jgi:hypothetical protein
MTWRQDGQEQNDKRLFFYFSDEQKPKWAGYIVRLPACLSLPAHPAEACAIKLFYSSNLEKMAAIFCREAAAQVTDMFCKFYFVKKSHNCE